MEEFTNLIWYIYNFFTLPIEILETATEAINDFNFNTTIFSDYLGYMRYGMGLSLFTIFTTMALISVAVSLWRMVVGAVAKIMEILPIV